MKALGIRRRLVVGPRDETDPLLLPGATDCLPPLIVGEWQTRGDMVSGEFEGRITVVRDDDLPIDPAEAPHGRYRIDWMEPAPPESSPTRTDIICARHENRLRCEHLWYRTDGGCGDGAFARTPFADWSIAPDGRRMSYVFRAEIFVDWTACGTSAMPEETIAPIRLTATRAE